MASGVKVNDQCMDRFQEVKMMSKKTCKRKFTVLKIGCGNSEIVPDDDCDCKEVKDFHCLLKELPADDGRYVIFDYPFTSKSGAETSKLILVLWCPGCATIKQRMLYASSKDAVKKMINEEVPEFMCDSIDDITEEEILAKLRR